MNGRGDVGRTGFEQRQPQGLVDLVLVLEEGVDLFDRARAVDAVRADSGHCSAGGSQDFRARLFVHSAIIGSAIDADHLPTVGYKRAVGDHSRNPFPMSGGYPGR